MAAPPAPGTATRARQSESGHDNNFTNGGDGSIDRTMTYTLPDGRTVTISSPTLGSMPTVSIDSGTNTSRRDSSRLAGDVAGSPLGSIAVLDLGEGENRLNNEFMSEVEACLDHVIGSDAVGLVFGGSGTSFCQGFDLAAVDGDVARIGEFGAGFQHLVERLLVFPLPVVAKVNGHAIAAGAVLALCADVRVQRIDRGWFSLPEVDLGAGFTPFLVELLRTKISPEFIAEATLTGRRYGGTDAVAAGVAYAAHDVDVLEHEAIRLCRSRGPKTRENLSRLKECLYRSVFDQPGLGA